MKWFFHWLTEIEGLYPEIITVFLSIFFMIFIAITRSAYRGITPREELNFNANLTGWLLAYTIAMLYGCMLFFGPSHYRTDYGLHSDGIIYSFRIALAIIFVLYLAYVYRDLIRATVFYTFEYYFFLVFAMIGLSLMTTASNFLNLLLFMELYSLSTYYLIQDRRNSFFSSEASFKYFTISSFGTAVYLFGVFLVYYGSGTIDFCDAPPLYFGTGWELYGYFFVVMSLFLKIGGAVFYFWSLDAYEGANYAILMFLNIFVKPVFVFVMFKILVLCASVQLFSLVRDIMFWSCVVGAIGGSLQTKIKRFLVFTSIYNIGFLSLFFWTPETTMLSGFVLFFFVYAFNSFVLMAALGMLRDAMRKFLVADIKDLSSLMPQNKPFAVALIFLLLVMAGLPPFSFFFAKYFLYTNVFKVLTSGYLFVLWVSAAVATFYYLRMIRIILLGNKAPTFFFMFNSVYMALLLSFSIIFNFFFYFGFASAMLSALSSLNGAC